MTNDERNEAVIEMLIRHRDEWYKFVLELIAELDTRQPQNNDPVQDARNTDWDTP